MKRAVLAVLVAAGLALVAAACGGGSDGAMSKEEYTEKVVGIVGTVGETFDQIGTASSPKQAKEQASRAEDALSEAAESLAELVPPAEVAQAHGHLVEGVQQLAGELGSITKAAESGDFEQMLEAVAGLESVKTLQQATEEFQAAGYEVSGEG